MRLRDQGSGNARALQVVLSESGLLKQTLQVFVDYMRPMLGKEYNVMAAFIPYLQSLTDDPNLVCGHALHMAVALLSMHLQGCEVGPQIKA